jgi:aquaporin Z
VVTVPGDGGAGVAFLAEIGISNVLMLTVLFVSNTPKLARYTGLFVGLLVFLYITFEAPLSGMSSNPARSFASAFISDNWTAWWVYFVAPPLGMLAAAQTYLWLRGKAAVHCAKMHHQNNKRCIFCTHQAALPKRNIM